MKHMTDELIDQVLKEQNKKFMNSPRKTDWWLETPDSIIVILDNDFCEKVEKVVEKCGEDTVHLRLMDECINSGWGYPVTGSQRNEQKIVSNFILDGKANETDFADYRFTVITKQDINSSDITVKYYLKVNRTLLDSYYTIINKLQVVINEWSEQEEAESYDYKEISVTL